MPKVIAELSIDTQLIIQRLGQAEIGELVPYSELSLLIGRDLKEAYHLTGTARRRLLKEKKYFQAVAGVGFLRCNDSQKVAGGGNYLKRQRRACARGAKITASVDDYDAMTREDQIRHNAQLSLLLTMRAMSTPGRVKAVESRVSESQQRLSVKSTLDAIAGSKKELTAKKSNHAGPRLPIKVE
jgi:hypothetical protein